MEDRAERLARVARGWDEAAEGYESYFVPRFAPWVRAAVTAVGSLPDGPILVPCCGTFPELELLTEDFDAREIVGIDLSPGMVRLARERVAGRPGVTVVEGDASTLDARWSGRCAAIVSVFGLQQLPEPDHALASWVGALRPGGRLAVVFWPDGIEETGPFALLGEVIRARMPASDRSWEGRLLAAITGRGATIERDVDLVYPMSHPDAAAFFDAFTRSGPLRALTLARGEAFMAELREEFLRRAVAGEWHHEPRARMLVARR
ncbi:class I SAM-dependent methyltransferase [Embleya sp. NPDC055664]